METTGKSYEQKCICSDNLAKHFKQNNKIKQNWKVVQNSNIWFCLLVIIKVIFLERRSGTMYQAMYPFKFEILLTLANLLRS